MTTISDPLADHTYGERYIFATIERKTLATTLRVDWTFTTEMSLQTYLRPFISSGNYYEYKELNAPLTMNYSVYGTEEEHIEKQDDTYVVDPDGSDPAKLFTFDEQVFSTTVLQTNAVFRWEYQPGSIFYLVWQQDRSAETLQ
ncbi:MAG: hypothetical protein R3281_14360 [Balneolaceae bacterium]|nr:hypothetical protein [Balneolaceae bacterium]